MSIFEADYGTWEIGGARYSIVKYRIRKQWALMRHDPGCLHIAAYFRSREDAEKLARAFGWRP